MSPSYEKTSTASTSSLSGMYQTSASWVGRMIRFYIRIRTGKVAQCIIVIIPLSIHSSCELQTVPKKKNPLKRPLVPVSRIGETGMTVTLGVLHALIRLLAATCNSGKEHGMQGENNLHIFYSPGYITQFMCLQYSPRDLSSSSDSPSCSRRCLALVNTDWRTMESSCIRDASSLYVCAFLHSCMKSRSRSSKSLN